jgi:hypothetical protein
VEIPGSLDFGVDGCVKVIRCHRLEGFVLKKRQHGMNRACSGNDKSTYLNNHSPLDDTSNSRSGGHCCQN